jgi:hypothetical protein
MPTDDHAADLRAAAERAIYLSQTCEPGHSESEENTLLCQLGSAVLAANTPDDGERITDDWLLSIGGEELTAGSKRRGIAVGTQSGMVLCWRWGHPDNRGWSLEHWDSNGECGWLELAVEPQTRGDFRRLAAALGVALKPAGGD